MNIVPDEEDGDPDSWATHNKKLKDDAYYVDGVNMNNVTPSSERTRRALPKSFWDYGDVENES